jgi:hypothetical protein
MEYHLPLVGSGCKTRNSQPTRGCDSLAPMSEGLTLVFSAYSYQRTATSASVSQIHKSFLSRHVRTFPTDRSPLCSLLSSCVSVMRVSCATAPVKSWKSDARQPIDLIAVVGYVLTSSVNGKQDEIPSRFADDAV